MIALAWIKPGMGMVDRFINLSGVIDAGISLIFFFYGLKLDPGKIRTGMSNWRMHLAIQVTTFFVFPLIVMPFFLIFNGTPYHIFWIGMFFLSALPSTVSSSVVMVSIARGNIPAAIFNASISGMIGIIVTPLWMGIFLKESAGAADFSSVVMQLFTQIIVPVIAGLLLHRYFVKIVSHFRKQLATFDKTIILLIVYESFSKSFMAGIFETVSWITLSFLFAGVISLFFLILGFTRITSRVMHFNREDSITMQFAASKKSLVHGSVFASVLFSGIPGSGVYLLPIMIYHAFQLFYISLLARKLQGK